jgi:hypothetical protein
MAKKVATADFIRRARGVHGDRYDYSKAVYVAARSMITITCPVHGDFEQWPANHYIGHGCPECGGNKPLTLKKFIERARKLHAGRYEYSRVELLNVAHKVEIICPDHGLFLQRPASHLKGFGCGRCGRVKTAKKLSHPHERFLEDARRAHGDRYDYSQVVYVNALSKVTVVCRDHGAFRQKPANHIRDVGCPVCGTESAAALRVRTTKEFVCEAKAVHRDRYDYSKVAYRKSHEKVEIVCAVHGSFWASPVNHVRGNKAGCPDCAESGFKPSLPGLLYYLAVTTDEGDRIYKIGITNLSVQRRFCSQDLARIRIIKLWRFDVGRLAAIREAEILSQFAGYRYYGPVILVSSGNSELFTRDVLSLDRKCQDENPAVVDAQARVRGRPVQLDLDFSQA